MIKFCRLIYRSLQLFLALIWATNTNAQRNFMPTSLRVDLLLNTDKVWKNGFEIKRSLQQASEGKNIYQTARIISSDPFFSWVMNDNEHNGYIHQRSCP